MSADTPIAAGPRRPLAELHAASDRLWYEYWMLRCVARSLSDDAAMAHALEESFALHLRNLYRFLYADLRQRASPTWERASARDLHAVDFLGPRWLAERPDPSPLLLEAVAWAERVVAPLRHPPAGAASAVVGAGAGDDGAGSGPRSFTLLQASLALQKVMDPFVSSTPRHLLGPRWKIVYEDVIV